MPKWYKKVFGPWCVHEWAPVQDTFEQLYIATSGQHWSPDRRAEMILVLARIDDGGEALYMTLPDNICPLEGFEPTTFADIPHSPSLLVGDQIGYAQLFVAK